MQDAARFVRATLGKFAPREQLRNPITFGLYGAAAAGLVGFLGLALGGYRSRGAFTLELALAWGASLLAVALSETAVERRLRARAARLPPVQGHMHAKRLLGRHRGEYHIVEADALRRGDAVLVEAGDIIPVDGTVIEGTAAVAEGAVTGESAPVLRSTEHGASAARGGTRVLSDWLVVRVRSREVFFDPLVAVEESSRREHGSHGVALAIAVLVATLAAAGATAALMPLPAAGDASARSVLRPALLVAFALGAVPIAVRLLQGALGARAMHRLLQANVVASSARAIEMVGDVDLLLLDKTGTLTLGDRHAVAFHAAPAVSLQELLASSLLASLGDETPEGRSILELAAETDPGAQPSSTLTPQAVHEFSAHTRLSGVDLDGRKLRKGAPEAMRRLIEAQGGQWPASLDATIARLARAGATPLVVADGARVLGVIELRDVLKSGISGQFAELRRLGVKTVLVTGDNPLTAAAVAMQVGVDDFLGDATPERKLDLIRRSQLAGHRVAMCGDGSNDAPALAQADVALVMNSGTSVAKEVGNLVDLDSNPTKFAEILATGRRLLSLRRLVTSLGIGTLSAQLLAVTGTVIAAGFRGSFGPGPARLAAPYPVILSAALAGGLALAGGVALALAGTAPRGVRASPPTRPAQILWGAAAALAALVAIGAIDLGMLARPG